MKLSADMRRVLIDELRFVAAKMKESRDQHLKLYFFSGAYGVALRVMNMEFDPELAFVHFVLNGAYATIQTRLSSLAQGQERGVGIPENLFERLEESLERLATRIELGEDTYQTLQTISNLALSTTGNGYYLYLKGMLSV